MRRFFLLILLIGLLAACGLASEQTTPPTAVPASPALVVISPTTAVTKTAVSPTQTATPLPPTATFAPSPTPTPAFPRYTGPPLQRDEVGIQLHIQQVELPPLIDHLQALGVGWVKTQVSWKLYQPQPDQYSADRLAELDAFVAAANASGVAVMLNVAKAPEWSRPTTELDGPPADYDQFRQFMQFLAARYQGRVAAYELWNEANLQREWNGSPLNAADLVALIAAGASGVRAADPHAVVISGAPATTGINDGVAAIDDRVYLRALLAAGMGDVVDGIGVHPYGWGNPPESSVFDTASAGSGQAIPSHNNHPSFFFKDTLDEYAALLAEFGVEKPLWPTEFGWGSFDQMGDEPGASVSPPAGAEFMAYVNEWQQAEYILEAFAMGQQRPEVGPMMLWNLNFAPILGSQFSESGYSVLRPDGSPRPAYLALQDALRMAD